MIVVVRPLVSSDRASVAEMLAATGAFRDEEIRTALEVLDDAVAGGPAAGWAAFAAEEAGRVRGYVCGGSTPLTASTWHVYWICVHPDAAGGGLGRALAERFEAFVRARGGERVVVETSGRPDYERARRFYEKSGFRRIGAIPDYYASGDDCVFYCKGLA